MDTDDGRLVTDGESDGAQPRKEIVVKTKYRTAVVTHESQVPAGFKRICEITRILSQQKKLSDLHSDGVIDAVKLLRWADDKHGPVWVNERQAVEALMEKPIPARQDASESPTSNTSYDAIAALTVTLSALATSQTVLIDAVERIASAVEEVARRGRQDVNELTHYTQSMNGSDCN